MNSILDELIVLETAALTRWGRGDPDGYLEICAPDVVYFDPYQEARIDGLTALTALYEIERGQSRFDRFEIINPQIQAGGNLAILTFNYVSYQGDKESRWNCTEGYRRELDGCWRIIQTHWSYTNVFNHKS